MVGINQEGYQEIIGYIIGFKESKIQWLEALLDIKNRGVEHVDIFVSDGFVGIESVIMSAYPNSKIQRCTVHLMRNLKARLSQKDTASVLADFSQLFRLSNRALFDAELSYLKQKYEKYSKDINAIFSQDNVTTYLNYPSAMHRTIKTTNRIEAVNQKIKTRIRFKQNFPNRDSLERSLVS